MYCAQCAAELPENARFCPNCASPVTATTRAGTRAPLYSEHDAQQVNEPVRPWLTERMTRSIVVAAALALLLAGGLAGGFYYQHRGAAGRHAQLADSTNGGWPGLRPEMVEHAQAALEAAIVSEEQRAKASRSSSANTPRQSVVGTLVPGSQEHDAAEAIAHSLEQLFARGHALIDQNGGSSAALLDEAEQARKRAVEALSHEDGAGAVTEFAAASVLLKSTVTSFIDDVSEKYRTIAQQHMTSNDLEIARSAIDKAKALQAARSEFE